jgi:perosamine synthetase
MINIYDPDIGSYKKSAIEAIESGWISNHGEFIKKSTQKLKEILNVKHAILMANGTCSTHCLFLALKLKHPHISKIYVSNNCYVAAWNCLLMEYDKTVIEVMKMDANTWNIGVDEEYIKKLEPNSAVLIVHNLGNIVNVPRLKRIRPDLIFIEDNCEGFTGKYENIYSGTSEASLCSSISFYGNKIITTGEGGAFFTNDNNVYEYILKVYSQGMSSIRYLHDTHAYNFRMTNIEAGFLYDQLNDFENIINNKKRVFENYTNLLKLLIDANKIATFEDEQDTEHANWIFALRLINNKKTIQEVANFFKANNIDIRPFFYSINKHRHLKDIFFEDPVSDVLNNEIIMIPSSPLITLETQKYVVKIIEIFINNINIIEINDTNVELLTQFISNPLPSTFRYFEKRTVDVIKDHAVTLLLKKGDESIGYAHIDYEKNTNKYWFGICILPDYHNKGYGNYLMNNVLIKSREKNIGPIFLTVDCINIHAIKLYSKHNFKEIETNDKYITMLLNN